MTAVDVKSSAYIDLDVEKMIKILHLNLMAMQEYQNVKIFLPKVALQIGLEKFLGLKRLKILFCRDFYKKELQKTNQTEVRVEKVITNKGDRLSVK